MTKPTSLWLLLALLTSPLAHAGDRDCLAIAVFSEASIEPIQSQRAVLDVIYNRMAESGKSACKIIKAPKQFSFITPETVWKADKYQLELLKRVRGQEKVLDMDYKWFYHPSIKKPKWARKMHCELIGSHYYCRKLRRDK